MHLSFMCFVSCLPSVMNTISPTISVYLLLLHAMHACVCVREREQGKGARFRYRALGI